MSTKVVSNNFLGLIASHIPEFQKVLIKSSQNQYQSDHFISVAANLCLNSSSDT